MKKYIDKHLEKDYIKPSLSVAVASVLLIRKSNGKLRFCVDYRAFNKIKVKNSYLIPLINKILRKLLSAACFTKLSIIHMFNRI